LRAIGLREIAAGVTVLMQPRRPFPLWMRVAGDAVDLALLGLGSRSKQASTLRIAGAAAAVLGVTALDIGAGVRLHKQFKRAQLPVIHTLTINRPPAEVYAFYRRFSQLPLFMDWLEAVREIDARHSKWTVKLPIGGTLEMDAQITEDIPGERIGWQSVHPTFRTTGRVVFAKAPGRDATEVRVEMRLGFIGLRPNVTLAKLFTRSQVKGDLRRLKQVLETGEVLYSDASIHKRPHPAQPSRPDEIDVQTLPYPPNPPTAEKGVTP
ncbi:MAG: SRPBCC family protein, partial [Rhizobacter sp.]|nr:SRPBCC family protein [Rhizobacter sp.]